MGQTGGKEVDVSKLPEMTMADVAKHTHKNNCWLVVNGLVLDVTDFMEDHPGGSSVLLDNAGKDASVMFKSMGHSQAATKLILEYAVGRLVDSEAANAAAEPKAASTDATPAAAAAAAPE